MENLQNAIELIDEKIINMAHLQELPRDLFRGNIEDSLIKAKNVLSSYPDVKAPFESLDKVYRSAIASAINGTSSSKTENYRFMLAIIDKTKAKISKAESAYQAAESDLQQSEDTYKEKVRSHAISLLGDMEMEDSSIDLAAINKTSAQQRMKSADNAITLLTLKLNLYKKILAKIDLEIKRDYYRETMNRFQVVLKDFASEFDKLKASALLAYPDGEQHETVALECGNDRGSHYSEKRIDKRIYDIFKSLGNYPGTEHETSLRIAAEESLAADLGESDLADYINKQYQHHLVELRSVAA